MQRPYHVLKLADELESRKRRNPSYTLRAFARHLNLPAPVLSEVLRQKRGLPKRHIQQVALKLALSPAEFKKFSGSSSLWKGGLKNLADLRIKQSDYQILDEERDFKIISEWEYYAVYELLDLKGASADPVWISEKLGISQTRATHILEGLEAAQLLTRFSNRRFKKNSKQLTTSQDVQSVALRKSHKESLEMAAIKLESVPIEDRFFSSTTMLVDKRRLDDAKALIREFRQKLAALVKNDNPSEVYQFCVQLFPLTLGTKGSRS